jgi:hypothetical protein
MVRSGRRPMRASARRSQGPPSSLEGVSPRAVYTFAAGGPPQVGKTSIQCPWMRLYEDEIRSVEGPGCYSSNR